MTPARNPKPTSRRNAKKYLDKKDTETTKRAPPKNNNARPKKAAKK